MELSARRTRTKIPETRAYRVPETWSEFVHLWAGDEHILLIPPGEPVADACRTPRGQTICPCGLMWLEWKETPCSGS